MPYSPSRGLLYSSPPTHESNRRTATDATEADETDADATRADGPTTGATPTPADD
jgi:hypothetical protein